MIERQSQLIIAAAVALASLAFIFYLSGIAFATNDDSFLQMLLHTQALEGMVSLAVGQGRFTYLSQLPIAYFPHFFTPGGVAYSAVNIGSLLIFVATLSCCFIYLKGKHYWREAMMFFVLVLCFWMNGWEHSMLSSYPLFFPFFFSLTIISLYCLDQYLLGRGVKFLVFALLLWFFSLNEYVLQYSFFPLLLIYLRRAENPRTHKALLSFVAVIAIYLAAYISFRLVFGSGYKGNHFSFALLAAIKTLLQFSFAGMPGYPLFSQDIYDFGFWPDLTLVLALKISALLVCILFWPRREGSASLSSRFIVIAAACILVPNVLISASEKYQKWCADGVESYLSSHMSFIAWVMLFVGVFSWVMSKLNSKWKVWLWKVSFFVVTLILLLPLEASNQQLKKDMQVNLSRWSLMDKFMSTEVFQNIPEAGFVYAPDIVDYRRDLLIANGGGYWSKYVSMKSGKELSMFSQYWRVEKMGYGPESDLFYLGMSQVQQDEAAFLLFSRMKSTSRNKNPLLQDFIVLFLENQQLEISVKGGTAVLSLYDETLNIEGSQWLALPEGDIFHFRAQQPLLPENILLRAAAKN